MTTEYPRPYTCQTRCEGRRNVIRIPREYKVGLLFFLLGCSAYAAIHMYHFRSHTEHRIEVTSFGLIGFGTGQLSFGWAVRRKKKA